ncbi:MAG: insulinase family protein, partial [Proteobacteria bacterium]|nr:insulinase family protein [Pseudomonadota bacterium]
FADLGDFTFVIVGNLELARLQPLVERYLGSLPSKGRKETWRDIGVAFPAGKITKRYTLGSEPKSFVELQMKAQGTWTLDGARDAEILAMAMGIRLREVLREDLGGVYGVQLWASEAREPTPGRELGVLFGCAPENVDKLRAAVFDEFARVAKGGLGPDYLTKVTETLRRTRETDRKTNEWWLDQIRDAAYYGDDFGVQTDLDAMVRRVTSANIQAAARRFFDPRHYVLGVMMPATK